MTLATSLDTLLAEQTSKGLALEAMPQAVFMLSATGIVLFSNSKAKDLACSNDGITVADRMLRASRQQDQDVLDGLIRHACAPMSTRPGGWMRLDRPSHKPPYAIFVSPFWVPAETSILRPAPVLVMVIDASRPIRPDADGLKVLFGLTKAEVRLALALAAGHDLASASHLLSVSPETLRSHLKALFRKTQVNRQQDLLRVLSWMQVSSQV